MPRLLQATFSRNQSYRLSVGSCLGAITGGCERGWGRRGDHIDGAQVGTHHLSLGDDRRGLRRGSLRARAGAPPPTRRGPSTSTGLRLRLSTRPARSCGLMDSRSTFVENTSVIGVFLESDGRKSALRCTDRNEVATSTKTGCAPPRPWSSPHGPAVLHSTGRAHQVG